MHPSLPRHVLTGLILTLAMIITAAPLRAETADRGSNAAGQLPAVPAASVFQPADVPATTATSAAPIALAANTTGTFTAPAPDTTTAIIATSTTVVWSETEQPLVRELRQERAQAVGSSSCVGAIWGAPSTVYNASSPQVVGGLRVGYCYRFSLVLDGAPAALSGVLIVVAPTAADPARLTTAYVLTSRMAYTTGRVDTVETITITNANPSYINVINLSAIPRALGYLRLTGPVTSAGMNLSSSWTNHTNLAVTLPPLAPGASTTIRVPFRLDVGSSTSAFGVRTSKAGGVLNLGEWFPIVSRVHDAYGIGDPQVTWNARSITFDLTLTDGSRGRNSVAASGDLVTAPKTSGTHWKFVATNVRDFAVSVSPSYRLAQTTVGTTVLKAYAKTTAAARTMLSISKAAFAKYNAVYGKYPYATFSIAQVGGRGFSMEFPTMVFMGRDFLANRYVIWHELAHQWFYGLLGNDQLREPWVDEAWAEFSARYFLGMSRTNCSTKDVNRAATSWPAGLTSGAWFGCQGYFETVYHRGTTFIDTIRRKMGTTAFFRAIRAYITEHRYGNVSGRNLLRYLDDATGTNLWGGPVRTYTSFN